MELVAAATNQELVALSQAFGDALPDGLESDTQFPKISTRGNQLATVIEGERKVLELPLRVVILAQCPTVGTTRAYYEGAYSPDATSPPTCGSRNGVRPDASIPEPQSGTCAACPQNRFGSASSGTGKGKACADSKDVYLVHADDVAGPIFQLRVAPMSLKALRVLNSELKAHNRNSGVVLPLHAFTVSISLTPGLQYSKLIFQQEGVVSISHADTLRKAYESLADTLALYIPESVLTKPSQSLAPAHKPVLVGTAPSSPKHHQPETGMVVPKGAVAVLRGLDEQLPY